MMLGAGLGPGGQKLRLLGAAGRPPGHGAGPRHPGLLPRALGAWVYGPPFAEEDVVFPLVGFERNLSLLEIVCFFVGSNGNLSLLDMFLLFSRGTQANGGRSVGHGRGMSTPDQETRRMTGPQMKDHESHVQCPDLHARKLPRRWTNMVRE